MKCNYTKERDYFGEPEEVCGGKYIAKSQIKADGGRIWLDIDIVCEKCNSPYRHWQSLLDEMLTDYVERIPDE